MERFRNSIRKCEVFVQKSLSLKKIFRKKKFVDTFLLFLCVNLPTVKIWGNRTNSLRVLALYSVASHEQIDTRKQR